MNIDALEAAINHQHAENPFSGVIHIRENGAPVFSRAYGDADKANARPNNIDTKFAVASGSKTLTAVAICQLVERGLLAFDTPLKDCLSIEFPQFDPAVTIHHLLSNTSGIPDYFDEEVMDDYGALWAERPMYNIRRPADFLPQFQHLPMKFAPGARFAYNNSGFIVLGLVIEQATGMRYTDYVQKHIFDPTGMNDCGFYETDRLPANTAYGYVRCEDGGWRTNFFDVPIVGGADGGVHITAPDMGKFWDHLRNNRLMGEAFTRKMLTPHRTFHYDSDESEGGYGYGIWLRMRGGEVHLYHAEGGDPGVEFYSGVVESRNIDFSVVANTDADISEIVAQVFAAVE